MFDGVVVAAGDGAVPDDPFDDLAGLDDLAELGELGDEADRVPDWLADPPPSYGNCAPSGWLALELDTGTADPGWLSDTEVIEAIVGFDRIGSWAAARQARLLAELARRRPADTAPSTARWACEASEYAPDEVGVALRLARGTAAGRIELACRLLAVHPGTHALWESGRIDTAKARAVHDATWVLPDQLAAAVEARVLPRAPEQTLAQLKAALARAVLGVDPAGADTRHRQARRDRRVVVTPEAEGMASLWALLTATDAAGAYTWLTRLARGLGPDDPRTMDARRADLLAALLNGRLVTDLDTIPDTDTADDQDQPAEPGTDQDQPDEPRTDEPDEPEPGGQDQPAEPGTGEEGPGEDETGGQDTTDSTDNSTDGTGTDGTGTGTDTADHGTGGGRRAIHPVTPGKPLIQIVMAHSTLLGADDQPAELVGHGPIPACLAREAAADAVWRRLVTDPLSGTVLDYGRTTYHPPAGLADYVRARDVTCRFPGCRRTAADAELDHVVARADGGPTSAANLRACCGHHHRLKHHAGWRVQAHPDGRLTWITPTGHRYDTTPHDYRTEPPPPSTADGPREPDPEPDPPPF